MDYCLGYWQEILRNYTVQKLKDMPMETFALGRFPQLCYKATGYRLSPLEIAAVRGILQIMQADLATLRSLFGADAEYRQFLYDNPFDFLRGLRYKYKYPPQGLHELCQAVQSAELFMLVANE